MDRAAVVRRRLVALVRQSSGCAPPAPRRLFAPWVYGDAMFDFLPRWQRARGVIDPTATTAQT